MKKKLHSLLIAAMISLSLIFGAAAPVSVRSELLTASAASVDYPPQLMNIAAKDNSTVLTENGTDDGSSLSMKALGKDLSLSWRFDRKGSDSTGTYFSICNAQSGRLLTPQSYNVKNDANVVVYGSESNKSQNWYVVPVKNDRLGNNLYYKIVNCSDSSLALTQSSSGITLSAYSGANNQLWLLNSDGLQGFAGYCNDDNTGNIKAGDIGGLFGETVYVSTFDDLKKYATSDTPYTIVVTENISVTSLKTDSSGHYYCPDGRIYVHSNKTIIGSYAAHTMNNIQFCTAAKNGVGNNIIIKNFELRHDEKSNGNDSIVVYFGSGENLWVDHVTFTGHSAVNTQGEDLPDWDKFLACCYDADYCTVSDSSFGLHEYGLILGYPADDENSYKNYNNFPRMSLMGNKFKDTITRGPGLMRYGYFHSLSNYVNNFSMAYTVHTASKIFAENCYYDGGSIKGNVICDWNTVTYPGSYAETGSKFTNCKRTTIEGYAQNCTWRPKNNYSYVSLSADSAKSYCSSYSGCQTSKDNMMYMRFSGKGIPSADFIKKPDAPVPAVFANGSTYRIKNVNSGLYMQVEGAKAENGANIQQWGTSDETIHDIWKLIDAGNGYYCLISAVGDGGTYALDVEAKKTDNGTNIDIYKFNSGTNQQFMLTQNADGSYKIRTRISGGNSAVEVAGGSKTSGANVQQWEVNGANCQDWILEAAVNPGCKMDTSVLYELKNKGSSMVMDITNGKMENGVNVQQWTPNDLDCQKWILKEFAGGGNYYYIRSVSDQNYVLKADSSVNGGNIAIAEYSTKDSAMLFKFSKNPDGSYYIMTRASKDSCLVEVESASTSNGANIQQWGNTNNDCQKWIAETITTATSATTASTETTVTSKTTVSTSETTATSETENTTEIVTTAGDINGDGKITLVDAVMLRKFLVKLENLNDEQLSAADICKDGIINVYDLILIKRLILS